MTTLLALSSSPNLSTSVSNQLVSAYIDEMKKKNPDLQVVERDLGRDPIPHLDEAVIQTFYTPEDQLSEEQKKLIELSNSLVGELKNADHVVMGSPMHNFGITSHLKTYFDHVARVGKTFIYTEEGPQGLLGNKKVDVIVTRGGFYSSGPANVMDQQEPYLRTMFKFLGITDVNFLYAEGTTLGDESKDKAIETVKRNISKAAA